MTMKRKAAHNIIHKTFGNPWIIKRSAHIKSTYKLTGKCFEMPNVSFT
jgi:hypothetical protein